MVNGGEVRLESPSRGLREGHPLSPYLFILYAKELTSLTRETEEMVKYTRCELIEGHRGCLICFLLMFVLCLIKLGWRSREA